MKAMLCILIAGALFAMATPVFAKNHFILNLEYCAEHASYIILASEGDVIDGQLTVLESWNGDLHRGDVISIPELKIFNEASAREIKCDLPVLCKTGLPPKYVSCSKMLLFLNKERDSL